MPAIGAGEWIDTDTDDLPDWWENLYNFNLNAPADALLDRDSDGLNNLEEYFYGTDPLVPDTDDDITDSDEINTYGTDPTVSDSDGDGTSDAEEVTAGSDPIDYYNGETPVVTLLQGDGQYGFTNTVFPVGLRISVQDIAGTPWANAPATLATVTGHLVDAPASASTGYRKLELRTDALGLIGSDAAPIFYESGSQPGTSQVQVSIGGSVLNTFMLNVIQTGTTTKPLDRQKKGTKLKNHIKQRPASAGPELQPGHPNHRAWHSPSEGVFALVPFAMHP
ncbi:MAG: hypothetical protein ACI8Z5_000994 [Lentimonas sp.]|jgi:hypothetical protein